MGDEIELLHDRRGRSRVHEAHGPRGQGRAGVLSAGHVLSNPGRRPSDGRPHADVWRVDVPGHELEQRLLLGHGSESRRDVLSRLVHANRAGRGCGVSVRPRSRVAGLHAHLSPQRKEAEIGGNLLPARRSYELRGDARHQITPTITARGNVNFFSDVTVQQTYHQNIFEASNRERSYSGNVAGTWGPYQLSGTFEANETFFGDQSATLWGGGPRVRFGQGQKEIPGTPFYFSFNSEYVRLLRRTTFLPGTDEELQGNSGLHRVDVNPIIQIPFTKWRFLTINSSIGFRSTLLVGEHRHRLWLERTDSHKHWPQHSRGPDTNHGAELRQDLGHPEQRILGADEARHRAVDVAAARERRRPV